MPSAFLSFVLLVVLCAPCVAMGFVPQSCPDHHGPNGCTCSPLEKHQQQQHQPRHPTATLPPHSLNSASTAFTQSHIYVPASRTASSFNLSNDYHDHSRFHDFHRADRDTEPHDQYLIPQLHPPTQPPQFHFTQAGESTTASNSGGKRKSSSAKTTHSTQSRKRPRVPAVATTEPPSLICGVGPPTTVENHSPPSTPVRSSSASHSVSASFQRPTYKRRPTEHSAAATDVWYFCRSQDSPTKPVEQPTPDQDHRLTRRPKSKFITCKLCS